MRRPPLLIVVIAALVLAACAADPKEQRFAAGDKAGSQATTTSSSTAPGTAPRSTTKPRGTATTAVSGGGGGGNTGTNDGGATPTTALRPVPPTVAGDDGSQGPPGAFARTLLRPQPATTIVFERFEQQGAGPRQASVDHATSVLASNSAKTVTASGPIAVQGGAKDWTADQLRQTADSLTTAGQGNGRAVLHVLFLHGTFEGHDDILGVTVRGDVIALFTDVIANTSTALVTRAQLEDAVLTHEVGHTLGLVDLARDTGRDDPEHPGHSTNTHSVMYWAVESSLVVQLLTGPPPRDFDSDDLADLRALHNGA